MRWHDKTRQLTFEDRAGSFARMQASRPFRVILVDAQHGTGIGANDASAEEEQYAGKKTAIKL